jgi:isoleucyl-tRNA synthetase
MDVGTPWLDAGIVPFSTVSDNNRSENIPYFHGNEKEWDKWFPAELVCEGFPGQFKNWFYVLLVMSQVLENEPPFKNLLGFANVVDEKGEEMHKSKGNAIWFDEGVEKAGADVMRWMYATANPANNLRFGFNVAKEIERKILILTNCVKFWETYRQNEKLKTKNEKPQLKIKNVLDVWVVSRLNNVIKEVTESLERFDSVKASLAIEGFWINDLSLWYVRRSRKRFQSPESSKDKEQAEGTLYYILLTLSKLIAPFMPFLAEDIYQRLSQGQTLGGSSGGRPWGVHLCDWLEYNKQVINEGLEQEMAGARELASLILAKRAEQGIAVRQALAKVKYRNKEYRVKDEILELIKDEVNVKEIIFDDRIEGEVELDTTMTDELKEEGQVREIIRHIQDLRKKAGLVPKDRGVVHYAGDSKLINALLKNKENILATTKSDSLQENQNREGDFLAEKEIKLGDALLWLAIT